MKQGIHPEYAEATITCACGSAFQTRSTAGSYSVDICGACHPFYTGKQRLVDTAGRVDRFKQRYEKMEKLRLEKERHQAEAAAAKAAASS